MVGATTSDAERHCRSATIIQQTSYPDIAADPTAAVALTIAAPCLKCQ
jgi:hypothetical protein